MEAERATEPAVRVSTLELFLDLVFVFTITQLTSVVDEDVTVLAVLRVMLLLGVIWWMYGGYAWLTNAVAPVSSYRRGMMIIGMAGFLVMALAIPDAFGGTGWAFGVGYFAVNLVHSGLFRYSAGRGAARAAAALFPLNLTSAGLVLAGGFLPVAWRSVAWGAALAVQIASPYLHPIGGFTISAAHFVERHGLVVIIALGESVVAIGVGARGTSLGWRLILAAVLGLVLAYNLWWAYFGGDDERAEHAMDRIEDATRRARTALRAYGYAHYPILLGIVLVAAGVKNVIGHTFRPMSTPGALALGGGIAVFLAGDLIFRRIMRIGRPWYRVACAVGALVTVPVGRVLGIWQLAVITAALTVLLAVEAHRARPAG
ncbi:low temperature requirement protein A [Rugosimonospora acidiphila]|uniref:Low temperature requirement protein A n=1 Tax=Rugosimonospora acidiphila TaxID=556531 RepID=A0ABP9RNL3_9ACTN